MKKVAILLLIVSLLSSGCGTTQPERTDAIVGGAAIGNSYNPQIEMFARFKMKSSFHKTKRII